MSVTIKAFLQIPSNADNSSSDTYSSLGELSQRSSTFSRNIQYVSQPSTSPGVTLAIFNAVDSSDDSDVYDLSTTECGDALTLLYDIMTDFDNSGELSDFITNLSMSTITNVTYDDILTENSINLPQYIQFEYNSGDTDAETYIFDVWTSNDVFADEYDVNETIAIPPMVPVTNLYQSYDDMQTAFDSYGYADTVTAINTQISDDKPTDISSLTLKWQDPEDTTQTTNLVWTMIGYGPNAVTNTLMLEAVRTYLTDNSSYTLDEWRDYFPDLETTNYFYVIPLFDQIAISTGTDNPSHMRPIFELSTIEDTVKQILTDRDDLMTAGELMVFLYRSTPCFCIPADTNETDYQSINTLYEDYTLIRLNTSDANRISDDTQTFITMLNNLITYAFTDDGSSTTATGITRTTEDNMTYLEGTANSVVYKVLTKTTYDDTVI